MGFADKQPSRMQGRFVVRIGRGMQQFRVGIPNKINLAELPKGAGSHAPALTTPSPQDGVMARPIGARPNDMSIDSIPMSHVHEYMCACMHEMASQVILFLRQKANTTNAKALTTKKTHPLRGELGPLERDTSPHTK